MITVENKVRLINRQVVQIDKLTFIAFRQTYWEGYAQGEFASGWHDETSLFDAIETPDKTRIQAQWKELGVMGGQILLWMDTCSSMTNKVSAPMTYFLALGKVFYKNTYLGWPLLIVRRSFNVFTNKRLFYNCRTNGNKTYDP